MGKAYDRVMESRKELTKQKTVQSNNKSRL